MSIHLPPNKFGSRLLDRKKVKNKELDELIGEKCTDIIKKFGYEKPNEMGNIT